MLASTPFTIALRDVLGERFRVHPDDCARSAVGGVVPKLVLSPRTLDEAARAVKIIAGEHASVVIRGAGTKSNRPPRRAEIDAVIDTSELRGVLEHKPGDLTATVAAGTPLQDLQFALRRYGQFFPSDAPFAASASLGGTLAANANGALRQRYGALRDNVLGVRLALSDGLVAFSGAKVVKSVAGYDTHKAFIGSRGTLGLIGEVTIKVAPLPATQRLLVASFADCASACAAATAIAGSPLFVMAMTLHDAGAAARVPALRASGAPPWTLAVRCGGSRVATVAQFDGAAALCKETGSDALRDIPAELVEPLWADIAELSAGAAYDPQSYVMAKFVAPPAQTHALVGAVRTAWPEAQISAHPYAGVLLAHIPAASASPQPGALWHACADNQWTVEFLSAPYARAQEFIAPLPAGLPMKVQRRLKAALDPAGTFDAGGFIGGI
ncbi:MAG TPA: FAD-binding oxidoreductase [Candidatus Eremiobacteraceae bacterium]|nr:FAD-binding oxidoreductase [Candidatus Eremiobacteraceae bacterium]